MRRTKTKAPSRLPVSTLLFFLFQLPKQLLKGLGFDHVHGGTTDLYPDNALRRAVSGQHLKLEFALKFVSRPEGARVSLGFCFGGFSSTAGYVPGNEARRGSEEPASDLHLQDDHSIRPSNRFYPFDSVLPEGKT